MYIEEVLNKGYQNNEIEAFRIYLEDPSLTFDLSKVSLDGGMPITDENDFLSFIESVIDEEEVLSATNPTVDQNDLLNSSILEWNRLGLPVGLNGSSGPELYTIPTRAKESIVCLQHLGTPDPFLIYLPNKEYTGSLDTEHNDFEFEVGKSYRLEFFIKFNNCTSATFSFFENTAAEWYTLYGLTFSNETETITDTEFRWHKVTTDIEKVEEGSSGTSKIMLNVSNFTTTYPERAMLAILSNLRIVEII